MGEFRLRIDFTTDDNGGDRIVFYNVESHEFIDAKEVVNPNAILNELVDYIRSHPGDFQLGAWRHLNQAAGATPLLMTIWPTNKISS